MSTAIIARVGLFARVGSFARVGLFVRVVCLFVLVCAGLFVWVCLWGLCNFFMALDVCFCKWVCFSCDCV